MTFSKDQLSQAFIEVLTERVPDLSDVPDHVFSERFEKRMQKLIRREAMHPWAVSHTLARNLIAAAVIIILLFALCMSVGAIRNSIFKFFREHFETHDDIVFEMPEKTEIEADYVITALPEGFALKNEEITNLFIRRSYEDAEGNYITLNQILSMSNGLSVDNERSKHTVMEIDGRGVYILALEDMVSFVWDQDGFVFQLAVSWENVTVDDAVLIFRSIQQAD